MRMYLKSLVNNPNIIHYSFNNLIIVALALILMIIRSVLCLTRRALDHIDAPCFANIHAQDFDAHLVSRRGIIAYRLSSGSTVAGQFTTTSVISVQGTPFTTPLTVVMTVKSSSGIKMMSVLSE